jgi:hypothetical protein
MHNLTPTSANPLRMWENVQMQTERRIEKQTDRETDRKTDGQVEKGKDGG